MMIGDVVSCRQWPGEIFAVMGPVDNAAVPEKRTWRLRGLTRMGHKCPPGHTAGEGDLTVIAHPEFEPGQWVSYDAAVDGTAEVVADNGATVRLRYQQLRPPSLDRLIGRARRERTIQICENDIDREDLVAENL